MGIIKNVDEFKEYQQISEKLGNSLFDIPGFHKVNAHLKGDEIEIQTSNSDVFWIPYNKVKKYSKEYNENAGMLSYITRIFQEGILARYDSEILSKVSLIAKASTLSVFEVKEGTLMNDVYDDMLYLGATQADASAIASSIEKIYFENEEDQFSPEGKALFIEYLNSLIEKIGATIYVLLEFLGKDDLVIQRVQLGNIDHVMESEEDNPIDEGEAIETGEIGIEFGASTYTSYVDYQKQLENIWRITDKAIHLAGQEVGVMVDYYTGRKPNATSIYACTPVKGTPLKVIGVVSPVEAKKVFGYNNTMIFSLESEDGMIDPKYMELKNEVEIADAIKKLL